MTKLILVIAFIAILFLIAKAIPQLSKKIKSPYFGKKPLNEKEQVVYFRLKEALPECVVLAQVRLADIVGVNAKGKDFWRLFNKINCKSLDFVVCNKAFAVLACIELDGKTHEAKDRKAADQTKDETLKAAGYKILRWKPATLPSVVEIRQQILRK